MPLMPPEPGTPQHEAAANHTVSILEKGVASHALIPFPVSGVAKVATLASLRLGIGRPKGAFTGGIRSTDAEDDGNSDSSALKFDTKM